MRVRVGECGPKLLRISKIFDMGRDEMRKDFNGWDYKMKENRDKWGNISGDLLFIGGDDVEKK